MPTVADYCAMSGVNARNALTGEQDIEVLRALLDADNRAIVQQKVKSRLSALEALARLGPSPEMQALVAFGEQLADRLESVAEEEVPPEAGSEEPEAAPEAEAEPEVEEQTGPETEPEAESREPAPAPAPKPEPETETAPEVEPEPEVEVPSETGALAPPEAEAVEAEPVIWHCRKEGCTHSGPPEDFGWREPGKAGKRYPQPYCRPCRRESSKASRAKKKAAVA